MSKSEARKDEEHFQATEWGCSDLLLQGCQATVVEGSGFDGGSPWRGANGTDGLITQPWGAQSIWTTLCPIPEIT